MGVWVAAAEVGRYGSGLARRVVNRVWQPNQPPLRMREELLVALLPFFTKITHIAYKLCPCCCAC